MINNKSVLAIITARGGSKGMLGKNMKPLVGKPLVGWTIDSAKKSKYIDRLILSSDNEEIIAYAKSIGCEVPFVRPAELAQDSTPGIAPVIHAIETLPEKYDYIVLLQPTVPFRSQEDIDGCIETCVAKFKSCVTISETKSPFWTYIISEEGLLNPLLGINDHRRQELPTAYIINGAVYVSERETLIANNTFLTLTTGAYVMPKNRSVDIDDELDLKYCELLYISDLVK